jgi:hypothetical protein
MNVELDEDDFQGLELFFSNKHGAPWVIVISSFESHDGEKSKLLEICVARLKYRGQQLSRVAPKNIKTLRFLFKEGVELVADAQHRIHLYEESGTPVYIHYPPNVRKLSFAA